MRRRLPVASVAIAVGLVAIALLWSAVAVPVLVKYPTDLDVNPRYAGTFTLFVDPTTAAPLAAPRVLPLEIDRCRRRGSFDRCGERFVPCRRRGDHQAEGG